jgi:hypothetical protein
MATRFLPICKMVAMKLQRFLLTVFIPRLAVSAMLMAMLVTGSGMGRAAAGHA